VVRDHLSELFNYDDITQLHQRLESLSPRLAEDLAAGLNFSQLLKVYRQLLTENVSLKDIVTIATTLVESATITKDSLLLTSDVRYALRTGIVNGINGDDKNLAVYTINNELENMLLGSLNQAQQAGKVVLDNFPVDPNILTQLQQNMPIIKEQMKAANHQPILLVTPQLRPLIARYARLFCNGLNVLSYNEVPDDMALNVIGTLE
jgi:flagellar biosynthesis protein FlhA